MRKALALALALGDVGFLLGARSGSMPPTRRVSGVGTKELCSSRLPLALQADVAAGVVDFAPARGVVDGGRSADVVSSRNHFCRRADGSGESVAAATVCCGGAAPLGDERMPSTLIMRAKASGRRKEVPEIERSAAIPGSSRPPSQYVFIR